MVFGGQHENVSASYIPDVTVTPLSSNPATSEMHETKLAACPWRSRLETPDT
jgi:hypothetical protein